MNRALNRIGFDHGAAALVGKQIHCVRCVMPQQMIRPAAGLAERIHVRAAKEVGLHIHLLNVEFASFDLLVHILMRRIEAPRVATHRHFSAGLGSLHHFLTFSIHITQRNFHLDMLACFKAGKRLRGMHLRGRAEDYGIEFFDFQGLRQIGGHMGDAIFGGHFLRLAQIATDQGDDFHIVNQFECIQMLDAESACAGESYVNHLFLQLGTEQNCFAILDLSRKVINFPKSNGLLPYCWQAHGRNGA